MADQDEALAAWAIRAAAEDVRTGRHPSIDEMLDEARAALKETPRA